MAAAAVLGYCATAQAGSLSANYTAGTLVYSAAQGEGNQVVVLDRPAGYELQDQALSALSLLVLGNGTCTALAPSKYRCLSAGITRLSVNLGDRADSLDMSATSLPGTITAGPGGKEITGGSGADTINAANGAKDQISCGAGVDVVYADAQDAVEHNCEQVSLNGTLPDSGAGSLGTSGGVVGGDVSGGANSGSQSTSSDDVQGSDDSDLDAPIGLRLPSNPVVMANPHRAVLTLGCSATAPDDCRGDAYLEAPPGLVSAARGHYMTQQRRLAHRKFNVRRGKTAKIPMRIAFRGHYAQVIRRRRVRATLRIVERDSAGNVIGMSARPVTLHAAANKWSRRRPSRRPVRR